jgi:hypothetical protein
VEVQPLEIVLVDLKDILLVLTAEDDIRDA